MRFEPFALPRAAFDSRLRELRFRFSKWDLHVGGRPTVAPGALVLSRAEHEAAVAASEALYAAATRMARAASRDPEATRALGVPATLVPLAREGPRVARIDLFLTTDGWRASEFNDDAPGGYNEAFGLAGDLPESLPRLVRGDADTVGLAYATGYAEDLQVVRLVAQFLASEGVRTVLASPASLARDGGAWTLGGEPVERVFRFYPAEWHAELPDVALWAEALDDGIDVVNPLSAAWSQSKASFAWLHEHAQGDDRAAVARHLPRTVPLTPETAREALAAPERWVLKPCFGRMGEGVVLGSPRDARGWRKALDAALQRPRPSVLQDRFSPLRVETAPGSTAIACVGAYVVDGRFAGYYSRISTEEVTTYRAANVLTVVEAV